MSNKTQLQTNNTALDALITRVNIAKDVAASLPKAGGGSGGGSAVETCTGTVKSAGIPVTNSVWYMNSDMQPASCTPDSKRATSFTAIKGSFVFIYGSTTTNRILTGVTLLYSNGYSIVVSIDSDNFQIVT